MTKKIVPFRKINEDRGAKRAKELKGRFSKVSSKFFGSGGVLKKLSARRK